MYTIGQISKQVHLSIDAIRYYDNINLIKPAYINPDTGYRYYSEDQIETFLFITELKAFDFSLDAIRELLDCKDIQRLNEALVSKIRQLELQMEETSSIIRAIHRRISPKAESNRVLIADDSSFMRMMQRDILTKHHYDLVAEASDGLSAIKAFNQHHPDKVVMNYDMPVMDGLEASSQIIQQDSNIKIMLCTKQSTLENILQALEIGMLDVVAKPFNMDRFLQAMEFDKGYDKANLEVINQIRHAFEHQMAITLKQNTIDRLLDLVFKTAGHIEMDKVHMDIMHDLSGSYSMSPSRP